MTPNSKTGAEQNWTDETAAPRVSHSTMVVADLERLLNWGTYEDRLEVLVRLRECGVLARPARQAILAALADEDELIAYQALQTFETVFAMGPEVLSTLANPDRRLRLAAIERVGKLLDSQLGSDSLETDGTRHGQDVPVLQTRIDIHQPSMQGKWIAWDEHHESALAVADDFPALMETIRVLGLSDPDIERVSWQESPARDTTTDLLDNESVDILFDIRETFADPDDWLDSPNVRLGYDRPRNLIGTPRERQLRYILRGFWNGITT